MGHEAVLAMAIVVRGSLERWYGLRNLYPLALG
jgi:hypothetical protein